MTGRHGSIDAEMRTRLLVLTVVTVMLAALAGRESAHAGAAACTASASGRHAREQLLAVHLSAGCPTTGSATGRPSFHPSVLLKLYIYGYLNRVQSSRRLEREAGRNLELLWLLGRLVPDHSVERPAWFEHEGIGQQCCERTYIRKRVEAIRRLARINTSKPSLNQWPR